jgi:hypothetical protein
MTPGTLAQVCDAVDKNCTWLGRPKPTFSLWERALSFLFPPRPLAELGRVGSDTFGYHYRMGRTAGHEATTKYTDAVKIGKVTVGQPKPVYRRGTRESRMAWRGQ